MKPNNGVRGLLDQRIAEVKGATMDQRRIKAAHHARCAVDEHLYPLLDRLVNGYAIDEKAAGRMCCLSARV